MNGVFDAAVLHFVIACSKSGVLQFAFHSETTLKLILIGSSVHVLQQVLMCSAFSGC